MSNFPPIAEYGLLSNCEQSCLVAPDGSVEWLCLPRPDSPSVFGALLDRAAGIFRFGPSQRDGAAAPAVRAGHERARDDVAHADRVAHRAGPAGRWARPDIGAAAAGLPAGRRATPARSGDAAADRDVLRRPGRGRWSNCMPAVRLRDAPAASGATTATATTRDGHRRGGRRAARADGQHRARHPRRAQLRPHDARAGRVGVRRAVVGRATARPAEDEASDAARTATRSSGATG